MSSVINKFNKFTSYFLIEYHQNILLSITFLPDKKGNDQFLFSYEVFPVLTI